VRSFLYAHATLQRKGLEYCPWKRRPALYQEAERQFYALVKEKPGLNVAALQVELDKRLESQFSMEGSVSHGG